jgi:hypothetical protein
MIIKQVILINKIATKTDSESCSNVYIGFILINKDTPISIKKNSKNNFSIKIEKCGK